MSIRQQEYVNFIMNNADQHVVLYSLMRYGSVIELQTIQWSRWKLGSGGHQTACVGLRKETCEARTFHLHGNEYEY